MIPFSERYYHRARPEQKAAVRRYIFDRDGGLCGVCGEPADFDTMHLDHVIPLARGGEDSETNLRVTHPACNRSKGASGDAPLLAPSIGISQGYMTLAEMAKLLSISQPTLRQQIAKGVLTAEKMGRDWVVSDEAYETYRRERWGKRGVASPDHPLHKTGGAE